MSLASSALATMSILRGSLLVWYASRRFAVMGYVEQLAGERVDMMLKWWEAGERKMPREPVREA
eukprot:3813941-Rhodomonas_salina.1